MKSKGEGKGERLGRECGTEGEGGREGEGEGLSPEGRRTFARGSQDFPLSLLPVLLPFSLSLLVPPPLILASPFSSSYSTSLSLPFSSPSLFSSPKRLSFLPSSSLLQVGTPPRPLVKAPLACELLPARPNTHPRPRFFNLPSLV